MTGKEKEVVDVELPVLATAVRSQRIGILQPAGIELLHADHVIVLQEESPIGFIPEEFEHRSGRLGAMAVFRFHQKHRLATLQKFDGTVQDVQLVAFDIDLHERHVLVDDRIKPRDRHMGRNQPGRRIGSRLQRGQAIDQAVIALRDEQFGIAVMIRQRDFVNAHIPRRGSAQQPRHLLRGLEGVNLPGEARQPPRVQAAIGPDVHRHRVIGNHFVEIGQFPLRRFRALHEMPLQPYRGKRVLDKFLDLLLCVHCRLP
jgi:hypothetical protein